MAGGWSTGVSFQLLPEDTDPMGTCMLATLRIERNGAPAQSVEIENRSMILDADTAGVPGARQPDHGPCRVEVVGHQLLVTDLGAPGGVYARGRRIERLALDPGEEFFVGEARITFLLGRDSPPAGTPNRTAILHATLQRVTDVAPTPHAVPHVPPAATTAEEPRREDGGQRTGSTLPSIEGYTLLRQLGNGSTGVAFLARPVGVEEPCVIKTIDFQGSSQTALFFIREAQTGLRMNHPSIVRVLDFGEAGGLLFLAMEYMEGGSLRERIERAGPLTSHDAMNHLIRIAGALEHAGRQRFVHRDIKPANILLTADGVPKLADWGLAKMVSSAEHARFTRTGDMRGTPMYMAPEVVLDGSRADLRSDVYSLGATYYYALCGEPPFAPTTLTQVLEDVLNVEPQPLEARNPEVHGGLARVIRRMMCKRLEDRYPDPSTLVHDLEELKSSVPS